MEAELRQRIEQLEKRQMQDDAVLNVVNRYWNQLNEDIRVLLQRFDAETADESENKSALRRKMQYNNIFCDKFLQQNILLITDESEATTSFLMQLSSWDKEELDDKLANRVQVSKRAVSKVVQAFDRLSQRNEKITLALKGEFDGGKLSRIPFSVQINVIYLNKKKIYIYFVSICDKILKFFSLNLGRALHII